MLKKIHLFVFCAVAATIVSSALGQASFTTSYAQSFDSLPATGTAATFSLTNWYSSLTTITASDGTVSDGGLQSLGSGSDRALGSLANDTTTTIYYGLQLVNSSAVPIYSISISYYGETWRRGVAVYDDPYGLTFSYGRGATALTTGNYFAFSSLDYVSSVPVVTKSSPSVTDGYAIDGNASADRTLITAVLNFSQGWQPGQQLWLRWADSNSSGYDSAIGIDDLMITAVPEPTHYGLIIGGALTLLVIWKRRRPNLGRVS